jgi:hypothetical protein
MRALIADQLRDTPEWSNRRIAGGLGVDHETVATVRAGLQGTGEFPQLDKTVGVDGKRRRTPTERRLQNRNDLLDDEISFEDEEDEGAAPDPKQEKARRREEAEQRRTDKEWEASGARLRARTLPRRRYGRTARDLAPVALAALDRVSIARNLGG